MSYIVNVTWDPIDVHSVSLTRCK